MEIQQSLVDETLNFINRLLVKAKVTIDGVETLKDIHATTIKNGTIRKYVYLETESGLVSRASLMNDKGVEMQIKDLNYQKKSQQGYMIVFPIQQKIEVVSQ